MKMKLIFIALVVTAFSVVSTSAAVAQDVPKFPDSKLLSRSKVYVPASASPTGKAGYLVRSIYGGRGHSPDYVADGISPLAKQASIATPYHNYSGNYWCTLHYVWVGTNRWTMWYTNNKYVESNTKTHKVTYAYMTEHQGFVSRSAQLAGWDYVGESKNAWTLKDWVYSGRTYPSGQHYSRYIGHFVAKVIKLPLPVAKRNPNICISVGWNGKYSFAGSKL